MAKKSASSKVKKKYPERAIDVPITQRMLYLVRDELKADIAASAADVRVDLHGTSGGLKADIGKLRGEMNDAVGELKADISGLRSEMNDAVEELKTDISKLRSDMNDAVGELKGEITELRGEMQQMRSDIHKISSELHRVALLVEEQNARNKVVLDGLTSLFARQERVESQVEKLTGVLINLK